MVGSVRGVKGSGRKGRNVQPPLFPGVLLSGSCLFQRKNLCFLCMKVIASLLQDFLALRISSYQIPYASFFLTPPPAPHWQDIFL